jgi:hypothetical protein
MGFMPTLKCSIRLSSSTDGICFVISPSRPGSFDISMDHIFRMDVLKPADQLIRNHQHRLEREMAAAIVEEVF